LISNIKKNLRISILNKLKSHYSVWDSATYENLKLIKNMATAS